MKKKTRSVKSPVIKGLLPKLILLAIVVLGLAVGVVLVQKRQNINKGAATDCRVIRDASVCNSTLGCNMVTGVCGNFTPAICPVSNCYVKNELKSCTIFTSANTCDDHSTCRIVNTQPFCDGITERLDSTCNPLGRDACKRKTFLCVWKPPVFASCQGTYTFSTCTQLAGKPAPQVCMECTQRCTPGALSCDSTRTKILKCNSNGCGYSQVRACATGTSCVSTGYGPDCI